MKKIKIVFILCFLVMLALPVLYMNTEENAVSEIDNTMLPEIDFESKVKTSDIDKYISKRIGFYDEAITSYITLNDKMFGEMVHPTYTYGKDGYVFFKLTNEKVDVEFIDAFCNYLSRMQEYCESRGIPFIYCINPSKTTLYTDYLPEGYNYRNEFLEVLYQKLEQYNINYISNVELLAEKAKTEQVYNVKYDAGHWNDLGAFYGTNNLLNKVSEYFPTVKEHKLEDFNVSTKMEASLPVSKFIINEEVPVFTCKDHKGIWQHSSEYKTLTLRYPHEFFKYYKNTKRYEDGDLPRVLFFHGSYYIRNTAFYDCSFKETYAVHNYQNIVNLEYYINIFKPECVILETAEYATTRRYFDIDKLVEKQLNPNFDSVKEIEHTEFKLSDIPYEERNNDMIYSAIINVEGDYSYGYLETDGYVYDLIPSSGSFYCIVSQKSKVQVKRGTVHLYK